MEEKDSLAVYYGKNFWTAPQGAPAQAVPVDWQFTWCKHSCRMRNPEREVGKSCFFLQIASQSHFSGAFEAENNENGCISALGLK